MEKFLALALFIFVSLLPALTMAQTEEYTAEAGSDGIQKVEITASSYTFTPKHIIVKTNVSVELSVTKESGLTPHNITLNAPETGIDFSESLSTEPVIIKFTPTKAGKYTFFCNKKLPFSKSHREKGMEGTLEVRD